jgi:hypothetical protein
MATDKTKAITAPLQSTQAQQFNPPRLKPERLRDVQQMAPEKRPVCDTYRDRHGRLYAFDGVSIRRVQG